VSTVCDQQSMIMSTVDHTQLRPLSLPGVVNMKPTAVTVYTELINSGHAMAKFLPRDDMLAQY